jgi:hypothetical protein
VVCVVTSAEVGVRPPRKTKRPAPGLWDFATESRYFAIVYRSMNYMDMIGQIQIARKCRYVGIFLRNKCLLRTCLKFYDSCFLVNVEIVASIVFVLAQLTYRYIDQNGFWFCMPPDRIN